MMHTTSSKKVGLEFSDNKVRFISLQQERRGLVPHAYAEIVIPEQCIREGKIVDEKRFTIFLKGLRKKYLITSAFVALPDNATRLLSGLVDMVASKGDTKDGTKELLQNNTSFDAQSATYEKKLVLYTKKGRYIQILAASTPVVEQYLRCFVEAGITPLSFEHPLQTHVSAILSKGSTGSFLVVITRGYQTHVCVVVNEYVVDVLTLDEGVRTDTEQYPVSVATAINQYYIDWHSNKTYQGIIEPITTLYISGVAALKEEYVDYLSRTLKLSVVVGNTWTNCFSFENIIPRITREQSFLYASVVGLALGKDGASVLPRRHKKYLKRKKYFYRTGALLLSFVVGLLAGLIVVTALFFAEVIPQVPLLHKIASWW